MWSSEGTCIFVVFHLSFMCIYHCHPCNSKNGYSLNISQMKMKRFADFLTQLGGSNSERMLWLIPSVALMASKGSAAKHKALIQFLKRLIFSDIQA